MCEIVSSLVTLLCLDRNIFENHLSFKNLVTSRVIKASNKSALTPKECFVEGLLSHFWPFNVSQVHHLLSANSAIRSLP